MNIKPENNDKHIQSFSRYEFKYILKKNLSDKIENESKYFMHYDSHTNKDLENRYLVRSLYFDNKSSSNFFEKVDGMKMRRKYRLRTYSEIFDKNVPIFLEMKGRNNERTYKKRTMIKHEHLNFFFDQSKYISLLNIYSDNNMVIKNFVFDSIRKKIFPRVLIDYKRRPYINKFGLYFRLTFDSNILASKTQNLFTSDNFSSRIECRAGYTILEVKFERSIPPWFHRIIQNYDLRRLSISKFVIGMEQCGIAHETSY